VGVHKHQPGHCNATNTALGYSFFPIFVLLKELGIGFGRQDVETAIDLLYETREQLKEDLPEKENPAKQLARKIHGKIPVIYGSSNLTDVIAVRWKGQFNENSKHPAFYNAFPELDHNEIMGFEGDKELLKVLELIVLRSDFENDRMKKRIDITSDIIKDSVSGITNLWPRGETHLEQMLYHIMLGDYVTAYLAILNEKDPVEIDFIDELKVRMKS